MFVKILRPVFCLLLIGCIACSCWGQVKTKKTKKSSSKASATAKKEADSDRSSSSQSKSKKSSKKSSNKSSNKSSKKTSRKAGKRTSRKSSYRIFNPPNMKAMWLSQFDLGNVYKNNGAQRDEADFTNRIRDILGKVKDLGINTIIVQVRPNGDSMYPSEVYPMSSFVVGEYGREATYDPFAIMVREAREKKLSVHAWINPMRLMRGGDIAKVNDRYRIKQWYNDSGRGGGSLVENAGGWFLNPASEEARKLVIDGAAEILAKYPVDGLHMDDYFYPTTDASFDAGLYAAQGGGRSLQDFRRDALNKLVAGLYAVTKAQNPKMLFGISPAGEIDRVVNAHCADVYTWCKEDGYIDYICPQIYFGLKHQTSDFNKTSRRFQDAIKNDKIRLIIGMTLGKAVGKFDRYAGTGQNEWAESTDILKRCLETTKSFEKCSGVAYFCYQYFYDPVSGAPRAETEAERANFLPLLKTIQWKAK